ncbi:hypothetical protein THAOC_19781, partial [Thalassiosira oceanica]
SPLRVPGVVLPRPRHEPLEVPVPHRRVVVPVVPPVLRRDHEAAPARRVHGQDGREASRPEGPDEPPERLGVLQAGGVVTAVAGELDGDPAAPQDVLPSSPLLRRHPRSRRRGRPSSPGGRRGARRSADVDGGARRRTCTGSRASRRPPAVSPPGGAGTTGRRPTSGRRWCRPRPMRGGGGGGGRGQDRVEDGAGAEEVVLRGGSVAGPSSPPLLLGQAPRPPATAPAVTFHTAHPLRSSSPQPPPTGDGNAPQVTTLHHRPHPEHSLQPTSNFWDRIPRSGGNRLPPRLLPPRVAHGRPPDPAPAGPIPPLFFSQSGEYATRASNYDTN